MEEHNDKFEIEYIRKSTIDEFNERFSKPNPDEAVFFIRFYNDKYGNLYKNSQIATMIHKSALPVFITDTLFIGKGALGGKLVPIQEVGVATGKMVIDVLDKKSLLCTLKPL